MEATTMILLMLMVLILLGIIAWLCYSFVWPNMSNSEDKKMEELKTYMENFTNAFLLEKGESISQTNIDKLNKTLTPFTEGFRRELDLLKVQIEKQNKEATETRVSLKVHMDELLNATQTMQEDAQNLTNALKGDSKTQGLWGEEVLKKTLENSGLVNGQHYDLQKGFKSQDGSTLIPDAIIYLPENRNIIIDSKVSLSAYERYMNSDNEIDKAKHLKDHITSLRKHMKELEDKYTNIEGVETPEFTFIFIPIESALSAAISEEWNIQKEAMLNNIAFTSPLNLIGALRITSTLWRMDQANENAIQVAKRAGLFYEKFNGLSNDLQKVGEHLDKAQSSFDNAQTKLSSGKGNLFSQVEKLKELGAKTTKTLEKPKID
ncbi:DNA recombination protein RmuC [Gammaproteobacteria bacterium]|nr:DNA recombination protein RmuC [Gammaproteobacteria bacterium]MDC1190610.1 DNA recombination protein RmuC [Gammaproteobacteria bacterium]